MQLPLGAPVRRPRMGTSAVTGWIALQSGGTAHYESTLERDLLTLLDFDSDVTHILVQPFSVAYEHEGKKRSYTPDVQVTRRHSSGRLLQEVFEVKYHDELRKRWDEFLPGFRAANQHCRKHHAMFSVMTERRIRTPRLANANFLRRSRNQREDPIARVQLLEGLRMLGPTTLKGLLSVVYCSESERTEALRTLWRLVATKQIGIDLDRPLSLHTPIHLAV